jgi:hypothetical protein
MFAYFNCCQCEALAKDTEHLDVNAAFDEGINPADLVTSARVNSNQMLSSARGEKSDLVKGPVPSTCSTNSGSQSARSLNSRQSRKEEKAKSMTEEQRVAEKARLQTMLKSFTRDSLLGLSCKIFDTQQRVTDLQELTPAIFFLDRTLTKLVVKRDRKTEVVVFLVDVVDLHSFDDLQDISPIPQIPLVEDASSHLRQEDRKNAVFIQHQPPGEPEGWWCLVVVDAEEQERFMACIKILSLYAKSSALSPSQTQASKRE